MYDTKTTGNVAVDDFDVTAVASTAEVDAHVTAGGVGASATISSLVTAAPGQTVFTFNVQDDGSGSAALNTIINSVIIGQAAGNTAANWTNYLAAATLTDGVNNWTGTIAATTITFSGTPLTTLPDGGAVQNWTLKVWLKTTLPTDADNKILDFTVAPGSFATDPTGASFVTTDPALESGIANNKVDIVATQFSITAQPYASVYVATNFTTRAGFTDVNGGIDTDYPSQTVTLSLASGTGILSAVGGLSKASSAGQASFTDLQYNQVETGVSIQAIATGSFAGPVVTNVFNVVMPPRIVVDAYPTCWDSIPTIDAVPFAVHISITNWMAGANQDCYLKVYSGSSNPWHYTTANGWKGDTFWNTKPIIHVDAAGNWSGWLPLKSNKLGTFQPRVGLVSDGGTTRLTGDPVSGTLLDLRSVGNGAILIDSLGRTLSDPGNIILVKNGSTILGSYIAENNNLPNDDGGIAIADKGFRLAICEVCEVDLTFESWTPTTWPGNGAPAYCRNFPQYLC